MIASKVPSLNPAGKYNLVLGEIENRSGPEFLALVLLAKIMQNPSNKEAIISEVSTRLHQLWDTS